MDGSSGQVGIEILLAHREWVSKLARTLVADAATAEDAAQEVWVDAMHRPPRSAGRLRGWLRTALKRNLLDRLRSESRRRDREEAVARAGAVLDDRDVVERAEALKRLVVAVLDLPEQVRTAVLLRYYENVGPTGIARRTGVPAETVRTRLKRGLDLLRRRLGADPEGRDRSWSAALLPLVAGAPGWKTGVVVMTARTKIAIATALVLLAGATLYLGMRTRVASPPPPPRAPSPVAAAPVPTRVETAPPAPATAARGSVRVHGRVRDARWGYVPAAHLVCRITGRKTRVGTSGRDGEFAFALGPPPVASYLSFSIRAEGPDGSVGVRFASLPTDTALDVDLGAIVLGAAFPLRVRVDDGGAPVAGARVLAGSRRAVLAEATTGADGLATIARLARGEIRLTAFAPGRRGVAWATVPGGEGPTVVALAPTRTIAVRVEDKRTGDPIAGARLAIWTEQRAGRRVQFDPLLPAPEVPPTDAGGRTRISGAPDSPLRVFAYADGYSRPMSSTDGPLVRPGETDLVLRLDPGRTVRFPLEEGDVPCPSDKTAIAIRPNAGAGGSSPPSSGRIENGDLVVEGWPARGWHAEAVAPDGAIAHLFVGTDEVVGLAAVFSRPRKVTVVLHEKGGGPAPCVGVVLRTTGGNNPVGRAKLTDGDGRVMFDGISPWHGHLTAYWLSNPGAVYFGSPVGTVDLKAGDGRIEAEIPAERELRLRVKVDGRPGLPPSLTIAVGRSIVRVERAEPDTGVVRGRFRPGAAGEEIEVRVTTAGIAPFVGRAQEETPGGPYVANVGLESAGSFALALTPPPDGRYALRLCMRERRDGPEKPVGTGPALGGSASRPVWDRLRPGWYRAEDALTGRSTALVEVGSGPVPAETDLDLSSCGYVTGRVEVPAGADPGQARVVVGEPGREVPVAKDGRFRVRVPGDRPVRLAVRHSGLIAADPGGTIEVTKPASGVVLRLVAGRRAVFRIDPAPRAPYPGRKGRVLLYTGEPGEGALLDVAVDLTGGEAAFAGYEPGVYTVWIDPVEFAPVVLRKIRLGEGVTDLGTIRPAAGASIRVRFLVPEGQSAPGFSAYARHLRAPEYSRFASARPGAKEIGLSGLGSGRFEVTVESMADAGHRLKETVDLAAGEEKELTLDLRTR